MEMENHLKELSKLCRLCKRKIKLSRGYTSAKTLGEYQGEIKMLFGYDIENDNVEQHPSLVCHKCSTKMKRIDPSVKRHEETDIATFPIHTAVDCGLCGLQRLSEHNFQMLQLKVFDLSSVETRSSQFCFEKLSLSTESCLKLGLFEGDALTKVLSVEKNLSWKLSVFGKDITGLPFVKSLPSSLDATNIENVLGEIKNSKVCSGNEDFRELLEKKVKGIDYFEPTARLEDKKLNPFELNNITIRTLECSKILSKSHGPERCATCAKHRKSLQNISRKMPTVMSSATKKKRPHSSLSNKQLKRKLFDSSAQIKDLQRQTRTLEKRLNQSTKKKGLKLDGDDNKLMCEIMLKEENAFEKNSAMALLWEQQKKVSRLKKSSSMKWHPVIIRWCLSIYLKSPGTYDHIRNTGFLQLPHRTTINQYTNFTDIGTGYNPDVIKRLLDDHLNDVPSNLKCCSLLFDEMKIKSGLVFSRKTGKMIGFTELGSINDEIDLLEEQIKDREIGPPELASHVLTVMARGIFKHFNFPIGYFATKTADASELYNILWEGVGALEMSDVKVVAFVCDGASQNRRFFAMHRMEDGSNVSPDGVVYWTPNKFDKSRRIYFFSDPPHLMKTIRNNLEKSTVGGTRNLMVGGKEIRWSHIRTAYELDLNMNSLAPGLRKLNRITFDHIHLTPRLRMRVNLAVQVLSKTMADVLQTQGHEHTKATQEFVRIMDQFFDCLNVTQTFIGQKSRKPALYPYKSPADWRFEWLEKVFLKYLNDWKDETTKMKVPKDDMAKYCISYQTLEGVRITVRSFIALVPELLSMEGVEYVLSEKFNQDPLEEHFGKQRARGGGIENPSLEQYMYNERKIIVSKSDMVIKGNTRGRKGKKTIIDINDKRELQKRPKK